MNELDKAWKDAPSFAVHLCKLKKNNGFGNYWLGELFYSMVDHEGRYHYGLYGNYKRDDFEIISIRPDGNFEANWEKQIAVDLDGTLAEYHGWEGMENIGEPIESMMKRVVAWLEAGKKVVIFTARANDPEAAFYIHEWLLKHGLPALEVTHIKRKQFTEFWDDRAISVQKNTGSCLDANDGSKMIGDIINGNITIHSQEKESALDIQVGGGHYKDMKIQPVEYCHANNMGGIESAVVKYVSRYKFKNGEQDIDKAIHLLQLLKQLEYHS